MRRSSQFILRNQPVKVNVQKKNYTGQDSSKSQYKKILEDFRLRLKRQQPKAIPEYFIIDKNCYQRHLRENWRNLNTDRLLCNRTIYYHHDNSNVYVKRISLFLGKRGYLGMGCHDVCNLLSQFGGKMIINIDRHKWR